MKYIDYERSLVKINGQILEYADFNKPIICYRNSGIDETESRKLFHKLKELFDEAGIKFSLAFGSLLGAVRNGTVIPGDGDMDVYTWEEEKLRAHLIDFDNRGLKVCKVEPGLRYAFVLDSSAEDVKSYIDVYIYGEVKGFPYILWRSSCIRIMRAEMPRKFFTGYREIEFLGEKVLCPENPEKLLEFWYGPDWRIPQDKKGTYRVNSAERVHHFIGRVKYVFKYGFRFVYRFLFSKHHRQQYLLRKQKYGTFSYNKAYLLNK